MQSIKPSVTASPIDHEAESFIRRKPVRLVIYAGLALFVVSMIVWPLVEKLRDPSFEKHIAEHRVMVGMSKEQVLQSWGGPQTINTTFTKDGIRQEEWIFEDWESAAIVKHRYLYFEEGRLIGGHFSGSDQRDPKLTAPDLPKRSPHPPRS